MTLGFVFIPDDLFCSFREVPMRRSLPLFLAMIFLIPQSAIATEVWLAGDPIVQQSTNPSYDYASLFTPEAPWQKASHYVQVFKASTQWLMNAPDAVLTEMFADLQRRNIALAVEALMTPQTSSTSCGRGVEGYSDTTTISNLVRRVQRIGWNADLRCHG